MTTEQPSPEQQQQKKVICCPNCKHKMTNGMYRKSTKDFRCKFCNTILKKEEMKLRSIQYFDDITGYRKVRRKVYDTDGQKYQVVTDEVPRVRRGKRQFDESSLPQYDRKTLAELIHSKYYNVDILYSTNSRTRNAAIRNAALIAFVYLTGARIGEVIGMKEKVNNKVTGNYIVEPVLKEQVSFFNRGKDLIWKVSKMPVFKRRSDVVYDKSSEKMKAIVPRRDIVLPYQYEKPFIDIIKKWVDEVPAGSYLFPISQHEAYRINYIFNKGYNHYWRHLRTVHLMNEYGFSSMQLQHYFGWASSKMADSYSHLSTDNLLDSMFIGYNRNHPKDDKDQPVKSESLV